MKVYVEGKTSSKEVPYRKLNDLRLNPMTTEEMRRVMETMFNTTLEYVSGSYEEDKIVFRDPEGNTYEPHDYLKEDDPDFPGYFYYHR